MTSQLKYIPTFLVILGALLLSVPRQSAGADDEGGGSLRAPANSAPERKKQIQFEDELVEGMNRNPLDSLEHIANQDMRDSSHLYKKKPHFRIEMKQQVREAGYTE